LLSSSINFSFANIQTKLKVSQPGDLHEQEADKVAEQIMKMSRNSNDSPITSSDYTRIDRKCKSCEEEEENRMKISRKENSYVNPTNNPEISDDTGKAVNDTLNQSGSLLGSSTKEFMESRFGYEFSNLRVHHDSESSSKSADRLNASAYTVGGDIVFGVRFAPGTTEGRMLLAHEEQSDLI
jgi:hypothetical protein